MALEIIGPGFGRTGTNSLKLALEQLGFGPCHHMHELSRHPEQVRLWQAAAEGAAVDWEAVFAGYRSQLDWPGARFWPELVAAFPQARVILTVRPVEAWCRSFAATIAPELSAMPDDPAGQARRRMQRRVITEQTFGGRLEDRRHLAEVYLANVAAVQARVPPGRLLTFDVSDGWRPLCAFLGVPEPQTAFPRTNDAAEFRAGTWTRPAAR